MKLSNNDGHAKPRRPPLQTNSSNSVSVLSSGEIWEKENQAHALVWHAVKAELPEGDVKLEPALGKVLLPQLLT